MRDKDHTSQLKSNLTLISHAILPFVNKLLPSNKIYISDSKITKAGRGVFARVDIKRGEVIERCPVIEIPEHIAASVNESILVTYIYYLGKNKERLMLALGFGSIYNHTDSPNTKYEEKYEERLIEFIAITDIKKGDEITVNYSQGQSITAPLWVNTA